MNEKNNDSEIIIRRGEKAGRIYFILCVVWMAQIILALMYKNNVLVASIGTVLNIGIIGSYVYLFIGIKALAREIADARLVKNMQVAIVVVIITWCMYMIPAFFTKNEMQAGLITLFIMAVTSIMFGIVSIRIGNDFKRLQPYFGEVGQKIARWQKLSGYLMVSIILFVIGAIFSVIADYYMWKLLQQRLREGAEIAK